MYNIFTTIINSSIIIGIPIPIYQGNNLTISHAIPTELLYFSTDEYVVGILGNYMYIQMRQWNNNITQKLVPNIKNITLDDVVLKL